MSVYDIILRFRDSRDDYEYDITDYYRSLSGSNQIIIESLNISCSHPIWNLRVTTPYEDSLDDNNNSDDVNESLGRLTSHLSVPIEKILVGDDGIYGENFSTGKEAEIFVLCIHPHMYDMSPICCGHCRGNIPYYLLPQLSENTAKKLTAWQTAYNAFDKLFYATGVGEMTAHKMLCNIGSKLNRDGLSICTLLEKELGKPVYYYLYRFYGKQPKKCPVCGGEWKQNDDSVFDYKCDKCRIVADKTTNE